MSVKDILTTSDYESAIDNNKLNVIKFAAGWCGPCKMLAPVLHEVADEMTDVNFYGIDIDNEDCESIIKKYQVTAVPTVVFIKNKEVVKTFSGFKPKDEVIKYINEVK